MASAGAPGVPCRPPSRARHAKPVADQVVVIAGASSGIGRATALEFTRRGARVVCAGRTVPALDSLVDAIARDGGQALAVPTDVAEPAQYTVRGQFSGRVLRHSLFTTLLGHRHRPAEVLGGLLAARRSGPDREPAGTGGVARTGGDSGTGAAG